MNRFVLMPATAMLFATTVMAEDNFNRTGAAGEAIIATSQDMELYEQYHFSPAYRAGDFVFLSGVVPGTPGEDPITPEQFRQELHKAFSAIKATLDAAGASFDQVVKLTTFHVFDSPHFDGDKGAHVGAFMAVKDEYLPPPYTAWTAIGISELFPDRGLVEIELIAHSPAD